MGPGWLPAREFWEIHFKVCFSRLINLQAPVSLLGAVSTADEPQPRRETLSWLNWFQLILICWWHSCRFNMSIAWSPIFFFFPFWSKHCGWLIFWPCCCWEKWPQQEACMTDAGCNGLLEVIVTVSNQIWSVGLAVNIQQTQLDLDFKQRISF